jgi:hypothetical protein
MVCWGVQAPHQIDEQCSGSKDGFTESGLIS